MTREYQPLVKFQPSEAELQPAYPNERLRQPDQATGELGHFALTMMLGGSVNPDHLGHTEHAKSSYRSPEVRREAELALNPQLATVAMTELVRLDTESVDLTHAATGYARTTR